MTPRSGKRLEGCMLVTNRILSGDEFPVLVTCFVGLSLAAIHGAVVIESPSNSTPGSQEVSNIANTHRGLPRQRRPMRGQSPAALGGVPMISSVPSTGAVGALASAPVIDNRRSARISRELTQVRAGSTLRLGDGKERGAIHHGCGLAALRRPRLHK